MQKTSPSRAVMEEPALSDPFSYAQASRDHDVTALVRDALLHGRAQLAFHPVITAQPQGAITFYEGLVRVTDDAGRILPAAHFVPQVEESALGRMLDCAALRMALQVLARRRDLRLSVNVSARSIGDAEWRRTLERGLLAGPDIGARLILEISETSAMLLPEIVTRFMIEMQPQGIAFALDGFGAGFTAFRHLKDFFFDLVKIDKSFVRGIDTDVDNQVLAEALITVARQFEMFTVADGVETLQEAAFLRRIGADCLQGYLFGMPQPELS